MRWAARYGFLDDFWRGRPRVFIDSHLHAVLRRTGTGVAQGLDPALVDLVDDMLPRLGETDPVWAAVPDPSTAAEMSRARPGTTFVPRGSIADVLRRAQWQVALIDLSDVVDAAFVPGESDDVVIGAVHRTFDAWGLFDAVRGGSRGVALIVPARDDPRRPAGVDYEQLADLVSGRLGGGRIFGVYEPPMVAVVDFAENLDPEPSRAVDEDVDDLDTMAVDLPIPGRNGSPASGRAMVPDSPERDLDPEGELDDDVPLSYDNSLGTQEPTMLDFVAVAGGPRFTTMVSDGLSLVELPSGGAEPVVTSGIRAQLASARRSADEAAIERQAQLERADNLERENFQLRRQLEDARVRLADVEAELHSRPDASHREAEREALDAVMAREQSLRWRISQLERELTAAQARPVQDLEAEVATLRARLEAGQPPRATEAPMIQVPTGQNGQQMGRIRIEVAEGDKTTQAVIRAMDGLVRRIERGGIGTLQLRRELVALRRRLQN
jgi:hypothetical protein